MVNAAGAAVGAAACLLAAGLWALAGPGAVGPVPAAGHPALLEVEGFVLAPTAGAGAALHCAAEAAGTGVSVRGVTPAAAFILLATGPGAEAQDFDVTFYGSDSPCDPGALPTAEQPAGAFGDDAGFVPGDARSALVYLYAGAAGSFAYREFPPLDRPTTAVQLVDTMHFRPRQVQGAYSTYYDLNEPHVAVAGTGAIYLAGHAPATDTHRSPAFVSRDDGATWQALPDPEPLPSAMATVPLLGGRLGQGNEGGIAADETGRAWLYDAAWIAGTAMLHGWCDDGERACAFSPDIMDRGDLALRPCAQTVRTLDRPWVRAAGGRVLLNNMGLRAALVDETRAVSMLGRYDPDTGTAAWNTCVAVGGMAGVPALRAADGHVALPQVMRTPEGEGWLRVHHGTDLETLETSPPVVRLQQSWQLCQHFSSYGDFDAAGTYHLLAGVGPRTAAVAVSADLERFESLTFDTLGTLRYMWVEGSKLGEGALVTWASARDCDVFTPVDFYAAHVAVEAGRPVLRDASRVVEAVSGTCGHYMGNDLGPDGRAYLIVHASAGACLGPIPEFLPGTHLPWTLYVQDAGPVL